MNRYLIYAAAGCALLSQPVLADTRDDVMAAMQRCRAIQDDRAWLDCTYGAEQPMRAKLGLTPAPEYQQRLVPRALPAPAVDAGVQAAQPPAPPRGQGSILQILTGSAPPVAVSILESIRYDSQGAFVITLQNGQVWRQIDADGARKPLVKIGAKVTVRPGALGTYNMEIEKSPHMYKVKPNT